MRDDERRGGSHRKFEDKIVIRIWKKRSPRKKHLLMIRKPTNTVDNPSDLFRTEGRQQSWSQRDCLILKDQRNRYGW